MAKIFDRLEQKHIEFIDGQKVFFVGTASKNLPVNISPKGIEPFVVIDQNTAAYIDYKGSGNRTAEDIADGSDVTIMFCSFDEKPMVLRLSCKGETHTEKSPEFAALRALWKVKPSNPVRQVFRLRVYKVQTSCDAGVPLFDYSGERKEFENLTGRKHGI